MDTPTGLLAILAIVTLGYIATCAIWPFKPCRTCRGTGRLVAPIIRAARLCPPCKGTGLRLRAGRHAWNALRRLHRNR